MTGPQGYTLIVCGAPVCHGELSGVVSAALRELVRDSRYGVLVVSGCTLGPVGCQLREVGPVVVVQPCDVERRPSRPAVRVGPIRAAEDIVAVRDWIRGASFDPALLPADLTVLHRATAAAAQN